ncbi:hypothetical protein F0562_004979 [Nyssa sinensis]|uniref:Uncharacterized protein n=1 Tax=Nyssa sinensis TaxID=561372 RepID=A0A5J5AI60_9ASTE|nr:hypothetical protein F0562_004979 [Nyssa sinensis]
MDREHDVVPLFDVVSFVWRLLIATKEKLQESSQPSSNFQLECYALHNLHWQGTQCRRCHSGLRPIDMHRLRARLPDNWSKIVIRQCIHDSLGFEKKRLHVHKAFYFMFPGFWYLNVLSILCGHRCLETIIAGAMMIIQLK